jgi:hypothetical protein
MLSLLLLPPCMTHDDAFLFQGGGAYDLCIQTATLSHTNAMHGKSPA